MTHLEICQRNKFGFCKYNIQCKLPHKNDICDIENCKVSQCEKRHPKECIWFRDFGRCKFYKCSYKHVKKRTIKSDIDDISNKIKKLEGLIRVKEKEEMIQTEVVKNLEKNEREIVLEERVRVLETFVLRLEEKLEMLEQHKKGVAKTDYSSFDHLHPLIRSNSLEVKCDECNEMFRNKARLAKHYENHHVYICEICNEWDDREFRGDAEIAKHNFLIHETQDNTLTDKEFEDITQNYPDIQRQITNGPDTPKRENFFKLLKDKKLKRQEAEKKDLQERREKRKEEEKRRMEEEETNLSN